MGKGNGGKKLKEGKSNNNEPKGKKRKRESYCQVCFYLESVVVLFLKEESNRYVVTSLPGTTRFM